MNQTQIICFALVVVALSFVIIPGSFALSCPLRCSTVEDVVWAIDSSQGVKRCRLFKNACLLIMENCERPIDWLPLVATTKDACQKYCKGCTKELNPVCGEYKGQFRNFGNPCALENERCNSGKYWEKAGSGVCHA